MTKRKNIMKKYNLINFLTGRVIKKCVSLTGKEKTTFNSAYATNNSVYRYALCKK